VPSLLGPETISVPLLAGHTLLGLMVIEAASGNSFSQGDLDAVTGVAAQTTMCIHNLRASRRSDARRLERDLQSAARVQRSLLPVLPSRLDGFKIKAEYRPAYEVGGDFYDAMTAHPGRLTAMVGDVAGKGVSGALVMARAVTEFRRIAGHARSPEQMLRELNDAFSQQVCDETFITAVCLTIDLKRSWMTVANAGHVVPLVRRASGQMVPVGGASGPPIGMLPDQSYRNETFPIEPGDIVLLMSDGILDSLHREGDELGMWALRDIVAAAPRDIVEINKRILEAVDRRTRGMPPDDITLVAIEVDSAYIVGA
jgi:phosphoserine phosphatase RsbU/P